MEFTEIEIEIRRRIRLSVYAYAYEFESESLISDDEYDRLSYKLNEDLPTGNKKMDEFFKTKFNPFTAQWIHEHPQLEKIKNIYERYFKI